MEGDACLPAAMEGDGSPAAMEGDGACSPAAMQGDASAMEGDGACSPAAMEGDDYGCLASMQVSFVSWTGPLSVDEKEFSCNGICDSCARQRSGSNGVAGGALEQLRQEGECACMQSRNLELLQLYGLYHTVW